MSHLSCASSVFCHLVPITRLSFKSYRSKIALWHCMVRSLLAKLAVSPTMPLDVSVLKQDLKIWPILGSFPCHNCEKLHLQALIPFNLYSYILPEIRDIWQLSKSTLCSQAIHWDSRSLLLPQHPKQLMYMRSFISVPL